MVTISLCMIVRDEETVLERCLKSVAGAVDEIVIVDTGSTDATKEIAARYTDKIYDFDWVDDFSAARNFSFSKARMDYCMWLDADDVLGEGAKESLLVWKGQADGSVDVGMLRYITAFDEQNKAVFSYYRERLLKRNGGFVWEGRVHEAIALHGQIAYLDICVEHHSAKKTYGDRNLLIYENMKREGVRFAPRDIFYYARELYYHQNYEAAVKEFQDFLGREGAFYQNCIEACRFLSYCFYALKREKEALASLLWGLSYAKPGGELCCDLGKHFYDRSRWEQAAFWYQSALRTCPDEEAMGFVQKECYGYLPCVQLSVCYDRMGKRKEALHYHKMAGKYKPYGREFLQNERYFTKKAHYSLAEA